MAGAAGAAGALAARALLMPAVDPLYGGGSPRHGSFRRFCPYHSSSAARISSVGPSRWYSSLLCSKKARNAGYSAPDELIRGGGRTSAAVVRAKRSSGRVVVPRVAVRLLAGDEQRTSRRVERDGTPGRNRNQDHP